MTTPERTQRPQQAPQDPFTEARTYGNFDSWLTQVSDERFVLPARGRCPGYSDEGARDALIRLPPVSALPCF